MLSLQEDNPNKKRLLKKVRTQFIHKKADPEPINIDPATRYLNSDQVYTLNPILGLVERNRRLYLGPEFLNQCYKISKSEVGVQSNFKVVTLHLSKTESFNSLIPWQYTTKRLESYGDLDLTLWAKRLQKYYVNYPKAMNKYFELIQSNDAEISDSLIEISRKVTLSCEEIERDYSYYKIEYFNNRESSQLLSLSYNEEFLKEIGHNVESFMRKTQKNGIPSFFENNCQIFLDLIKRLFDGALDAYGPPIMGSEFVTAIVGEDGGKKEVSAQFINFIRPVNEGFYFYSYLILGKKAFQKEFVTQSASKFIKKMENEVMDAFYKENKEESPII